MPDAIQFNPRIQSRELRHAMGERPYRVILLTMSGHTQQSIARRLKCGQGTVSKDLARLAERFPALAASLN